MTEEALQVSSATTQTQEPAAGGLTQVRHRAGLRIEQLVLDRAIAQFLRIQFWGIRWQPDDLIVRRMSSDEVLYYLSAMGVEPVPHDDERPPNPAPEGAQGADDLLRVDTAHEVPCIQAG